MNKKSANRQLHKQSQHRLKPVYAAVLLAFAVQTAGANPIGGTVTNGSAGFATSGNTLTVTNTPGTIINWQGFSIGSNEVTRFAQQSASSTVLNRVVGSDPSNILGKLQSNGRVFLINPNGILFGAGAVVDVAGLVASTLNLSDADFKAGNYHFTAVPGAANISNAGSITAQDSGQIYLIAPNVENTGVITAPNGEILLAAGHSVELVNSNDPNLRVNITAPAGDATNVGKLIASSGSLGLFGTVVSNSGIVNADSATMQGGKIVFKSSQLTEISGTVSANGTTGGNIEVLGNQVGVLDGATVSANGIQGGGTILIGGDAHGTNPDVPNSQFTYVAPTANISADATQSGDGGKVVVWADNATQFGGNISARGGAVSGNGGWVEVSGKQWLGYAGLVNTTAANGMVGSLLLDPMDITISNAADTVTMIPVPALGGSAPTTFADATALTTSNLNITTLTTQLVLSNVTVDTTSVAGTGVGSITVQDSIAWTSANSLTLNATGAGAITVNAVTLATGGALTISNAGTGGLSLLTAGGSITVGGGISLTGGTFTANAGGATSDIIINSAINTGTGAINLAAGRNITDTGTLSAGTFTLGGGTWNQVSATLPSFTVTDFQIAGGTFIRAQGGDGVNTPYQLADIYGVQGMGSAGMLGNSYVLANNIDASGTQFWNTIAGASPTYSGFAPVAGFTGQFDGLGHTISNLYINRPAESNVGLFGYVSGGSISNIGLVNASVMGASYVGGLVGSDYNGSISNSYISGISTVTGTSYVGGLVGNNSYGSISNSHVSNATVSGGSGSNVGGLVGYNYFGSISNSYVDTGTVVSGGNHVGGLLGWDSGEGVITGNTVTDTTVNGNSYVGGLAGGINHASTSTYTVPGYADNNHVVNSFVNGGTGSGSSYVGGLVGLNGGAISNSYVSGGTVTGSSNVGGLVGLNQSSISNNFVNGVTVSGGNNVGGLVGQNIGGTGGTGNYGTAGAPGAQGATGSTTTISNSYVSGGSISGGSNVGGLVGLNSVGVNGPNATSAYGGIGGLGGAAVISNSYVNGSTVSVSSGGTVGGLVGYNSGTISSSYVSGGSVNAGCTDCGGGAGGLAGYNGGTISNSYVSGGSVIGAQYNGGLVGQNVGTVYDTYTSGVSVTGAASGTWSWIYVGGLVGNNTGTINTSYASSGTLSGGGRVGGVVGSNDSYGGAVVSASFWNTTTAGTGVVNGIGFDTTVSGGTDIGATGLDSAGMMTMSNFTAAGWSIANTGGAGKIWRIYAGYTAPLLTSFLTSLTISADPVSAVYTGTAYSGPLVKPVYSPTSPVLTHVLGNAYGNATNAGTYAPAYFSDQQGYDISYVNGQLTVTAAPLTVTASNLAKTYGVTQTFLRTEFTSSGLQKGETIGSVSLASAGAAAAANVAGGPYAITASAATGGTFNAGNYTITYVGGNLSITARPINVAADAISKVYGDADPALTYTVGGLGLASGDTNATTFTGALTRAPGENVATSPYAISQGNLAANTNYTITSFATNNLTITPATLTVAANAANKILNAADPLLTYMVAGLKFTDTAATTLTGELSRVAGETVGTYQINQGSLGLVSANYTMNYVSASFTILVPTVINEIMDISNQNHKKPKDEIALTTPTPESGNTQGLPVCN